MEDGLYKVQFRTPISDGAGVVHKVGQRLYGGDSGFAWTGQMQESGATLNALLEVVQHNPGFESVFGSLQRFELALSGSHTGNSAVLRGVTAAAPGIQIEVTLSFLRA
ncbi:hypothetical protein [Phenylobacterium sp.]|uniref:hypothetical protein n=1 Tax=Phenylobacterium sp. TaxID=1871053 RepID=UPI00391D9ECF